METSSQIPPLSSFAVGETSFPLRPENLNAYDGCKKKIN
jgi:hypothetical protein